MHTQILRFVSIAALLLASSAPHVHAATFVESWQNWQKQPVTAPITMTAIVGADVGTSVNITIGGNTYTVTGAGTYTASTNIFTVELKPQQQYPVAISGSSVLSVEIQLQPYVSRDTILKSGSKGVPMPYRVYLDDELNADFQATFAADGSNSTNIVLEVRPDRGFRPVFFLDSESQWNRDQDPAGSMAPGDAYLPDIGPGRSSNAWSGGLRWAVNLGRLRNGTTCGMIRLDETFLSTNLYTAAPLSYTARSTNTDEVMAITNTSGQLRQIRVPQTLVDIQATNSPNQQCTIKFYLLSQVSATTNGAGLYSITNDSPFVTWRILNPDAAGATNRVQFIEERPGRTNTSQISYSNLVWTLTAGAGAELSTEARTVSVSGLTRTETVVIQSPTNTVYKAVETYYNYAWGWELTNVISNPDGNGLTNSFTFYTDNTDPASFGKLKDHYYPGGRWERTFYVNNDACPAWTLNDPGTYFYYAASYTEVIIRPWQDAPSNPSGANITNVVQSFSQYTGINLGIHESWEHSEYLGDWNVQTNLISDSTGIDGPMFDSNGQQVNREWGTAQGDWRSYQDILTDTAPGNYLDGLLHNTEYNDDHSDYYEYSIGAFNWASYAFTASTNGADFSSLTTHGSARGGYSAQWANGLYPYCQYWYSTGPTMTPYVHVGKSTQEHAIYQGGNKVFTQLLAMNVIVSGAPVFAPVEQHILSYDTLGHLTNDLWMDVVNTNVTRTVYQASWAGTNGLDCELKAFEINETGEKFTYAYDSLKRVTNITHVGIAQSGSYPAQSDIGTNFVYDAASRELSLTVKAGSLSMTSKTAYDLCGRVTSASGLSGTATNFSYSTDTRTVTNTLPGGVTIIYSSYLDGRPKSKTGTGVVNEFYRYYIIGNNTIAYPTAPQNVTHTEYAVQGGARWKEQATTISHNPRADYMPGFNASPGTAPLETDYTTVGGIITQKSTPATMNGTNIVYYIENYSPNGYGDVIITNAGSSQRISGTDTFYEYDGTNWFQTTSDWTVLDAGYVTNSSARLRLSGYTSTNVLSDVTIIDQNTNTSHALVYLDRANKKITATTNTPQSVLVITNVTINSLLQTESSASVVTPNAYFYDTLARQTSIKDALGNVTSITYDPATGWEISSTDGAGNTTVLQYYGATEANAGKVKCRTAPNGKQTWYDYTLLGEPQHLWGDVPYPEERVYNNLGEQTELRTFQGGSSWSTPNSWPDLGVSYQSTFWNYDAATGLLLSKVDALGRGYTNNYLLTRTLWTQTWARGVTITNTFNEYGEVVRKDYSDGTPSVVYNTLNLQGNPTSVTDAIGTRTLNYDFAGRLLSTVWNDSSSPFYGLSINNNYDPVYGRNELTLTGASVQLTHDYRFDTNSGRLNLVSNGTFTVSYGYLPNSDLLQTTTSKSNTTTVLTATRVWDYGFRLRGIANTLGGSAVAAHNYLYDALNRRIQDVWEDNSQWQFGYNDRNELSSAKRFWADWTPVAGQQYQFVFDNIGNRTTAKEGGDSTGANLRSESYGVNALNQYTSRTVPNQVDVIGAAYATAAVTINGNATYRKGEYYDCALTVNNASGPAWTSVTDTASQGGSTNTVTGNLLTPPASQNLSYDLDGNLTNDAVWVYIWDAESRLIQMSNLTTVATAARKKLDFTYDYQGHRVQKIVSTNSGSAWVSVSTNRYVYDGWNLIAVLDPQSSVLQSFVWGHDLSGGMAGAGGIGGLLMITTYGGSNTNCFTGYDGNGNLTLLADAFNGAIDARYDYTPFGEITRATGLSARQNPFRFSTKYLDEESGLVFYPKRYYSPTLGRWLSRDMIEERGGNNLFAFLNNSSIGAYDAFGMDGTLIETDAATADGEAVESGGLVQAFSFLNKVRQAADTFNNVQQISADLMKAADGDTDDLLIDLLSAGANALSGGLASKSGLGLKSASQMHHIFPQQFRKDFAKAGIKIDQWLVRLKNDAHIGVHQGGWNADWKAFLASGQKTASEMFDFAIQMMQKYGVTASQL